MCAGVVLLRLEQGNDIETNKIKAAQSIQGLDEASKKSQGKDKIE